MRLDLLLSSIRYNTMPYLTYNTTLAVVMGIVPYRTINIPYDTSLSTLSEYGIIPYETQHFANE